MSVYVDDAKYKYGRMIMCHMIADNLNELHAMANNIGVDKKHFQWKSKVKHYDICKAKRAQAIKLGAVQITTKDLIKRYKSTERKRYYGKIT